MTIINYDVVRWLSRDPLANAEMRQGPNLYVYVGNGPVLLIDPLGLWGVFGFGGASGEAGAGSGFGAQGSSGVGVFGGPAGPSLGGFTDTGAFGSDTYGGNANEFAGGASVGVGAGIGITNAHCAGDLKGPFDTWTLNTPFGSIQFAQSNGIWTASYSYGRGLGFSFSRYTVTTTNAGSF